MKTICKNNDIANFLAGKPVLTQLGLVLCASVLFAASFPNPLFENGVPFLAWFAYIPIIILIRKNSILTCAGWGAVYGFVSYTLFNYWLITFNPLAGAVVYTVYLIYLSLVFVFFKLADIFFPKKAYLVQWLIWLTYEYLRTVGFLGYTYGITGYSQWLFIPLIQIASITGVWGVSALVTFPSFWLAGSWERGLKKEWLPAAIWAAALVASLVFGIVSLKDFSSRQDGQYAYITLVQQNTDPWEASRAPTPAQTLAAYRKDLEILTQLSDEALAFEPKTHLVVWPETAFIPRIYWHTVYRENQDLWLIVRDLLTYLEDKDVPFLIGNNDSRMDPTKNPNFDEKYQVDYNAAILFENGEITGIYRKIHLVPFTEHFPYKRQFPFVYEALKKADTNFWEKGEEYTVFEIDEFSFSAPICFEDTFGYISRIFVKKGADVLVNLTNDTWANSLSSQNQHLSKAVFRAVENHRSMVRSTTSGQTCAIDPNGRITAMAPPFTEAWINVSVPLVQGHTAYTLYGDYLAIVFAFAAFLLLLLGAVCCTIRRIGEGKQ